MCMCVCVCILTDTLRNASRCLESDDDEDGERNGDEPLLQVAEERTMSRDDLLKEVTRNVNAREGMISLSQSTHVLFKLSSNLGCFCRVSTECAHVFLSCEQHEALVERFEWRRRP